MSNNPAVSCSIFEETGANLQAPICVREPKVRRRGWQPGVPICLADGMPWHIPRVDLILLMTTSLLQPDLSDASDLADEIQQHDAADKEHLIVSMLYHAQMANIAVRLLQVNYDLPDGEWKRLLTFPSIDEMLRMTCRVSQEIARATPVWVPMLMTSGRAGNENLLVN